MIFTPQYYMSYFSKLIVFIGILVSSLYAYAAVPNIKFVSIPSGSFIMGTPDLDDALIEIPPDNKIIISDEQPAHKISISAFDIGKYEITQDQWLSIMGTKPGPDSNWQRPEWKTLPVVSISWSMTQAFINKLNRQSSTFNYRLPTEAEFEYVLREGNTDLRPFPAEDMDSYAWTITNSSDTTQPIGTLRPNAFGVYDSFGNAWEWVSDWYAAEAYAHHEGTNPRGPAKQTGKKVRRGGSYHCQTHIVRSGYRAADPPSQRYSVLGFRLVRFSVN